MATNYVLIDFENVQPNNLEILSNHPFKVFVFVGASQAKIPFELAAALQHRQRRSAIIGLLSIGETEIPQQVLDDPAHRGKVVHDEDLHVLVQFSLRASYIGLR